MNDIEFDVMSGIMRTLKVASYMASNPRELPFVAFSRGGNTWPRFSLSLCELGDPEQNDGSPVFMVKVWFNEEKSQTFRADSPSEAHEWIERAIKENES